MAPRGDAPLHADFLPRRRERAQGPLLPVRGRGHRLSPDGERHSNRQCAEFPDAALHLEDLRDGSGWLDARRRLERHREPLDGGVRVWLYRGRRVHRRVRVAAGLDRHAHLRGPVQPLRVVLQRRPLPSAVCERDGAAQQLCPRCVEFPKDSGGAYWVQLRPLPAGHVRRALRRLHHREHRGGGGASVGQRQLPRRHVPERGRRRQGELPGRVLDPPGLLHAGVLLRGGPVPRVPALPSGVPGGLRMR
mmetsp:Transcript_48034/g.126851  ORF Transcript_48034/g.126851 Transcript_48034/m.126851 type:complete len:248 (+) Transcript_48034:2102-2845(+)